MNFYTINKIVVQKVQYRKIFIIGLFTILFLFFFPATYQKSEASSALERLTTTSYIHVCPNRNSSINNTLCQNGMIQGFVDDSGKRFIPNMINPTISWLNTKDNTIERLENTNYEDWMAKLEAKGINSIYLRLDKSLGTVGLQATPLGYYYIGDVYPMDAEWIDGQGWVYSNYNSGSHADTLIDGEDFLTNPAYTNCRYPNFTVTNCGSRLAEKFINSNITKILQTAEEHDIYIMVNLWAAGDYYSDTDWSYNPFNVNCKKPDDTACSPSEAGVLTNGLDFIFDPKGAIPGVMRNGKNLFDYQKQYIDFLYKAWGESPALWLVEPGSEFNYIPKWQDTGGDPERDVDLKLLPWVESITNYIRTKDTHNRPLTMSSITPLYNYNTFTFTVADPRQVVSSSGNPCDYNATYNRTHWDGWRIYQACVNKMFDYVDTINIHDYYAHQLKDRLSILKQIQFIWPGRPIQIGEFDPPSYDYTAYNTVVEPTLVYGFRVNTQDNSWPNLYELEPFYNTKAYNWLTFITNGGNGMTQRWMGYGIESWDSRATYFFQHEYNLEHFSDVAKPVGRFIKDFNWNNWINHSDYDNNVTISNHGLNPANDFIYTARGDGNQVMMMFRSVANGDTSIQITHMMNGGYVVRLYDWLSGDVVSSQTVMAVNDALQFNVNVQFSSEDTAIFRYNQSLQRYEGSYIDSYTSAYTNIYGPHLPTNWGKYILSDWADGHENYDVNKYHRNMGVISVEYCTPTCQDKQCGSDGCGGSCGSCEAEQLCRNYHCLNKGTLLNDTENMTEENIYVTEENGSDAYTINGNFTANIFEEEKSSVNSSEEHISSAEIDRSNEEPKKNVSGIILLSGISVIACVSAVLFKKYQ